VKNEEALKMKETIVRVRDVRFIPDFI